HDGETELEAAINELVVKRRTREGCPSPTALVLPAGNTFLDRLHGVIRPADFAHDKVQFHWRVQPNDRTPSYLELWFWEGFDPHGYSIELWDPWGELESSFEIGADASNIRKGQDPNRMNPIFNDELEEIGQISADKHRPDVTGGEDKIGRWRVLIVLV